jgi:DNA-binding CsgD family transcriptional regulator/tetratricopeptide (TPR) repeat protein
MQTPLAEWPIVPRVAETAQITAGLTRLPVRVQLIVGPAGIGKTTLAEQVVAAMSDRVVVPVIALAELSGVPLGAFAPALARLGLPTDPARAIPELLAAVGRAAARHLLVIDDLPRLDDVSAAAVYQLVRAFGVPTLATARLGEAMPGPAARLVNEGLTTRHDLAGLRADQVDQLLETRYGVRPRYADVVRLAERTDGNPLYLRVLIEGAERVGAVHRDGTVVSVGDVTVPADLTEAMADRLAVLSADERRLLRLAALLQPVDCGVLAVDADQASAVARLESLGLLVPEQGSGRLRISHPLVTEALQREAVSGPEVEEAVRRLRMLDTPRDRLLAVRLALSAPAAPAPDAAELVWAAGCAYGMGDYTAAVEFAQAALARGVDRAARCSALLTAASAYSLLGDAEAAERTFAEAEAIAVEPDELALLAVRRGEHLSYRRFDLPAALEQAERIRARIAPSQQLDESLEQWGASLAVVGGMPLLGRLAFRIKPELTIRAAILAVVSKAVRGDSAAVREAVAELSRIQAQLGQVDPLASAALGFARFVELICAGQVAQAAEYLEQRRIDADDGVGVYTCLLANLRQCGGRLAEAERLASLAVEQLRWRDGLGFLGIALGYQANIVAKRGRVDEARRLLAAMTRGQRTSRGAFIQCSEAEAWILVHSGKPEAAVPVVEKAALAGAEAGYPFLAALATCVLIRLGFVEPAARILTRICAGVPPTLKLATSIRDLAVALRDRDWSALPATMKRVVACGQEPTVLDAIEIALRMRPPVEVTRKLAVIQADLAGGVDEPLLQRRGRTTVLTPREYEVARAAAARERSREIAARLGVSVRTVDTQLQSVYRKLGVSSRDELREVMEDIAG